MNSENLKGILTNGGIGAGIGALGMGGLTALNNSGKPEEDKQSVMQQALLGAGLGGVAGAGGTAAYQAANRPAPFGETYTAVRSAMKHPGTVGATVGTGYGVVDHLKQRAIDRMIMGKDLEGGKGRFETPAIAPAKGATASKPGQTIPQDPSKLIETINDIKSKSRNIFGNEEQGFANQIGKLHSRMGFDGGAANDPRANAIRQALKTTGVGDQIPMMEKFKDMRTFLPEFMQKWSPKLTPKKFGAGKGNGGMMSPKNVTEILGTKVLPGRLRASPLTSAGKGVGAGLAAAGLTGLANKGLDIRDKDIYDDYVKANSLFQ